MAIIDIISEDVVKTQLVSVTKDEVIKELIRILKDAGKIKDVDSVYAAITKRETQGSTGLERGIAVPHAKSTQVESLTMAVGIAPGGIDFASIDGKPSTLFFLILAPPDQSGPHIEALSEIARLARSTQFCDMLLRAKSAKEVLSIFRGE
jgi:fructose-specific phosphotransferase system IIA component